MADSLTVVYSSSLRFDNLIAAAIQQNTFQVAIANRPKTSLILSVGTSEVDITLALTNPGLAYLFNLDPTNYVQWGPKSGGAMVPLGRLKPYVPGTSGLPAAFELDSSSVTLRMIAHTAACNVLIEVYSL